MAISDKVIDLAPVNKTKNIILYITLGLLVALSAVFIVLFAIKPSVTPVQVNAVTITKNDLYPVDGAYTASNMCVYTLDAQVGVTGDVKSTLAWTHSPSGVLYDLTEREEEVEDENGVAQPVSRFSFRVAGDIGQKVTVTATSTVDGSKFASVEFTIVEGVAGEMSLSSITGNGKTSELLFDEEQQAYTTAPLPYFKTASEGYRTYTVSVSQLGLGGIAQMGDKSNVLKAESSAAGVINVLSATDKEVRFRAVGTGEAELTVTANAFNQGDEIVKKLKLSVQSTDSLNIISKFYLYPNGGLPAEKPDYDALDKLTPVESLTLYVGDNNFVLEDHLLVRPFGRMKDLNRYLEIKSSDVNVVREGDRNNKKTLNAAKAGRAEVTIIDKSSANAGAQIKLSVEVRSKLQNLEVSGSKPTEGLYTRTAFRAQNGSIPLLYTFAGAAATFDHTFTDCDLTVYAYEGSSLAAKPYDNKGAIKFNGLKDGVIPVSTEGVIKESIQIAASVGFEVDGNAAISTFRYRFIANSAGADGNAKVFDIAFNVATQPTGMQWVTSIEPGPENTIGQFLSLKARGEKDAELTLNLGTSADQSVSVADLLQFTIAGGKVDDAAKPIGLDRITLSATSDFFAVGERKPSDKITPRKVDTVGSTFITVRLYANEKKEGTELANIKLYIRVIDTDKTAVVGTLNGKVFTPFAETVQKVYSSDTNYAYNAQSIPLTRENFSLYSHTWGDQYDALKANEYRVAIRLPNGTHLTEKDGRYYATGSAATAGTDALFEFKDGTIYVLQDFFILHNVYDAADYSAFTVHYYLDRNGVIDGDGCAVSYQLIREIQDIKLYKQATLETVENYDEQIKTYKLEKNQGEAFDLWVAGLFRYKDSSAVVDKPISLSAISTQPGVQKITQGEIGNGIATSGNPGSAYNTHFTCRTGIESGKDATGNIIYNGAHQSITIAITVRNMSAPVQSIALYTDAEKQHIFTATEAARYELNSKDTLTLYFDIVYQGGAAFLNYEPVNFALDRLCVGLPEGTPGLDKFEVSGTPTTEAYTASGTFKISVTGNSNGDARWTLSTPSGMTQTYYFYITTLLQGNNAVEVKYDGKTVYSGASDTLDFALTQANDKPQKALQFAFISADTHNPQFPIDKSKYTFTGSSQYGLITVSHNMDGGTIVLQTVGKTGTDIVTLTFTEAGTNNTYTVTLTVTVTADVHTLEVMQDGAPVQTVHLNALGADADEWNKVAFDVRFNSGNLDRQPQQAEKDKLTVGLQKQVGNEWQAAPTTDLKIVKATSGYELQFKNALDALDGNYRIEVKCGAVTAYVIVTLQSSAYVVKFDSAKVDIFKTGTYSDFAAKIYPVNGSTAVALPAGFTLTYRLTDLSGNALSNELATVNAITGAVTVSGTQGSFKLVATLTKSGATKAHAAAEMQIDVNNLVYYIVNSRDFPNQLNGNGEILLIKGNALDFADYIVLQSFDRGTPYTGADFAVASSGGLTVSGKTVTATTAGDYTVTLTANQDIAGVTPLTRTVTIKVVEPTVSVDNATVNAIERTAIDCAVTVSGQSAAVGTLTVREWNGENEQTEANKLFTVKLNGTVATLTLKTEDLDLSTAKTATFRATYTVDGQSFYKDFTVTVKAEGFVPTFVLQQKLNANTYTQVTGELDINDIYRFTYTGDASHTATYAITAKPTGATDPTGLQGDFQFGSVGTWKARASVTLFGVTFTSSEATYTVLNRTGITSAVYSSTTFTDANKITTVDGFYTDTPKTVYVALDVSGTSYSFADAVSNPTAYFEITANNDCVVATGTGTYNSSTKRYYIAFTVQKAGSVSFYGKAKVNGVWQSAPVATLAVTEPSSNITATYRGSTVNPGAELNLADSEVLSIAKGNSKNTLTPTYSYEVIAGDRLVATKPANGSTNLTIGTCLSTGGTVTVRVTATYNSGWFNGTTATATFDIPVNTVAAPTISLAQSNITLTANTTSYQIGAASNAPLPTVTAGAGDSVGTPTFTFTSSNTDIATVTTNGIVTVSQKGVRFTITATTTVGTGAWKGYELSATYTFYVEPQVTFVSGDVTPGETIDLNDFVTIIGNAASYKFTATYATSATNVTVANNGLVGGWTAGAAAVTANITITEGDLVGFTFTRNASFNVLALSVSDLTVAPGTSGTLTASVGSTPVSDVIWTTDSDLIAISGNTVSVAENANMTPEGESGTDKTAYVVAEYKTAGKTYKARLTVTVPAKAKPAPTVKVGETPITSGTHAATLQSGDELIVTVDTTGGGYTAAAYNTPFVVDEDGIFAVNVTMSGNVYSVRLMAQKATASKSVKIQYTVHGYTYTAVTLNITVESAATADSATLTTHPYSGLSELTAKQIATGTAYTYTFSASSGSFRYFTIETSVGVSIMNVKNGTSSLTLSNGLYDTQGKTTAITFDVYATSAGAATITVKAASGRRYDYYADKYTLSGSIVSASASLTVMSRAFNADDITLDATKAVKVGESCNVSPTPANGYIFDHVKYELTGGDSSAFTVDANGNVTKRDGSYGTANVQVTAYAAGTSQQKTVAVTFYDRPTATLCYSGYTPTLTVTQNGATVATGYSASYAINTTVYGTIDPSSGQFTATPQTSTGVVRVTATVTYNSVPAYGNLTLTATDDITVGKAAEPSITVSVNASTKIVTVTASAFDLNSYIFTTSNPNVSVVQDGTAYKLVNSSTETATDVTVTVLARCNSGVYTGQWFRSENSNAVTVEGITPPETEPTLSAAQSGQTIDITNSGDWTNIRLFSDNAAVTVEKAGDVYTLKNAMLQAQSATITIVATYNKAGSNFIGKEYVKTVSVTVAADAESAMSAEAKDGQITVTHDERLSQLGTVTYQYVVSDADMLYIEIDENGAYTVKPGDEAKTVTVTVKVLVDGTQHGDALSVTIDVPAKEVTPPTPEETEPTTPTPDPEQEGDIAA